MLPVSPSMSDFPSQPNSEQLTELSRQGLLEEYFQQIATLKARIEELEGALRKIMSGTEDIYFPLRAMPRETMRQIANDALEAKHD